MNHSSLSSKKHRCGAIGTAPSRGCLVLACLMVAGCGPRDLHRVSGRVTFPDGSPVACGRVVIAYGDGRAAWGRIYEDGGFTIGTRREDDGMKAGTYRVAIKDALVPGEEPGEFKAIVHPRFADPATSGLQFTIPGETDWQIVVEPPATGGQK